MPVLESKSENLSLGGAANVANNLVALGCNVYLAGGIGRDEKGDKLLDLIKNRSINTDGVYRFVHRPTTSKVRVIANNQQVLRIDKEDDRPITEETENKFIKYLHAVIPEMDGVICSDYHKGILTEKIASAIMQRAKKSKKQVVVDPANPAIMTIQLKVANVGRTAAQFVLTDSVPFAIESGRALEWVLPLEPGQERVVRGYVRSP